MTFRTESVNSSPSTQREEPITARPAPPSQHSSSSSRVTSSPIITDHVKMPTRQQKPLTTAELHDVLEKEQEAITNNLLKRLDELRKDKIRIEAELEAESEAIVNRLTRQLSALKAELGQTGNEMFYSSIPSSPSIPPSPSRSPSRPTVPARLSNNDQMPGGFNSPASISRASGSNSPADRRLSSEYRPRSSFDRGRDRDYVTAGQAVEQDRVDLSRRQSMDNERLRRENQELKDEIRRLKGVS